MKPRSKRDEIFVVVFWSPLVGKVGYRGVADAITSKNKVGEFDILPEHTNFITLIFNKLVIYTKEQKKIEYEFKRGVLEASDNLVKIFLGI